MDAVPAMLSKIWRRMIGRWWVDDPRQIAREAPYTFFLPHEAELAALSPGDLVKLTFRAWPQSREWDAERMWVIVTEAGPDGLVGALDNFPSDMPQLKPGKRVRFQRHQVIDLEIVEESRRPEGLVARRQYWERCLVDQVVLSEGVAVAYLYREEPEPMEEGETYPDSGWRIRGDYRGLSHEEIDAREMSYVALGAVLNRDDSWLPLIDAPVGAAFLRDFETDRYVAERQG